MPSIEALILKIGRRTRRVEPGLVRVFVDAAARRLRYQIGTTVYDAVTGAAA